VVRQRKKPSDKTAFRKAFTQGNVRGCIEQHDKRLAEVYDELYQRTIDTGTHPNELAVSGSLQLLMSRLPIAFI
jgi:hypothetical protein